MRVQKIGFAWFDRENYDELKALFTDGDSLPDTFDQWQTLAERGVDQLRREGKIVIKAYLDPKTFPEWCRSRGLDINSAARRKFAAEFAAFGHGN